MSQCSSATSAGCQANSSVCGPESLVGEPRANTFYMRELPDPGVSFSSQQGRKRLTRALAGETAESFWALMPVFHTQSEPALCGPGTLAMVLNSLNVDPGREWKGVWRWFDEELLDCCVPMARAKVGGITLDEFACTARCNFSPQGTVAVQRPDNGTTLEQFRADVKRACSSCCLRLVVSYSRPSVGQTGSGHFSPIAAYDKDSDSVLILDVARFKLPPHWLPLQRVYEAMKPADEATGKSRGWVMFERLSQPSPSGSSASASVGSETVGGPLNSFRVVYHPLLSVAAQPGAGAADATQNPSSSCCGVADRCSSLLRSVGSLAQALEVHDFVRQLVSEQLPVQSWCAWVRPSMPALTLADSAGNNSTAPTPLYSTEDQQQIQSVYEMIRGTAMYAFLRDHVRGWFASVGAPVVDDASLLSLCFLLLCLESVLRPVYANQRTEKTLEASPGTSEGGEADRKTREWDNFFVIPALRASPLWAEIKRTRELLSLIVKPLVPASVNSNEKNKKRKI